MPAGLGGENTTVRITTDNGEALDTESMRGDVFQAAQNFYRQQVINSAMSLYAHKVVLVTFPDGGTAVFEYKRNHGQEYLTMRLAGTAAEEGGEHAEGEKISKEEREKRDMLCLFVFHDGDTITAFTLGEYGPKPLRGMKFRRAWGNKKLMASQFTFQKGKASSVLSPLHMDHGLQVGKTYYWSMCGWSKAFREFKDTGISAELAPLQASDGIKIYIQDGNSKDIAVAIGSDGTCYYQGVTDVPTPVIWAVDPERYSPPQREVDKMGADIVGGGGGPEDFYIYGAWQATGKDGGIDVSGSMVFAHGDGLGNGSGIGTISYDMYAPKYKRSDSVDKVNMSVALPVTIDINYVWSEGTSTGVVSLASFLGVSGEYHYDLSKAGWNYYGDVIVVGIIPFPPGLENNPYYEVARYNIASNTYTEKYVQTPYEKFDVTSDAGVGDDAFFKPWLHISNGKHYIQGFEIGDETHLYYDGKDMSHMLGKIKPNDIQMMIMDIPMGRLYEL